MHVSLMAYVSGAHLQGPEQVGIRGLGDVSRGAIGQHQLEPSDRVDSQTVLVRLERVTWVMPSVIEHALHLSTPTYLHRE